MEMDWRYRVTMLVVLDEPPLPADEAAEELEDEPADDGAQGSGDSHYP